MLLAQTRLLAGEIVPIGWVAVGDPAPVLPPDAHDRIREVQQPLNFLLTVYGFERAEADMVEIMRRLIERLSPHLSDRPAP